MIQIEEGLGDNPMQRPIYALIAIMALASPAFAQAPAPRPAQPQAAPPSKGMTVGDAGQFVAKATMSNMLEIETSRMALERTKLPAIRDFAQTMVADHTKASQELDAILKEANANAPVSKLDASYQQEVDRLKKADAARFDREYVAVQVKAHDEAIASFRSYAQSGTDARLKAFAQKMLPDLERHATMAKKLPQQ